MLRNDIEQIQNLYRSLQDRAASMQGSWNDSVAQHIEKQHINDIINECSILHINGCQAVMAIEQVEDALTAIADKY